MLIHMLTPSSSSIKVSFVESVHIPQTNVACECSKTCTGKPSSSSEAQDPTSNQRTPDVCQNASEPISSHSQAVDVSRDPSRDDISLQSADPPPSKLVESRTFSNLSIPLPIHHSPTSPARPLLLMPAPESDIPPAVSGDCSKNCSEDHNNHVDRRDSLSKRHPPPARGKTHLSESKSNQDASTSTHRAKYAHISFDGSEGNLHHMHAKASHVSSISSLLSFSSFLLLLWSMTAGYVFSQMAGVMFLTRSGFVRDAATVTPVAFVLQQVIFSLRSMSWIYVLEDLLFLFLSIYLDTCNWPSLGSDAVSLAFPFAFCYLICSHFCTCEGCLTVVYCSLIAKRGIRCTFGLISIYQF